MSVMLGGPKSRGQRCIGDVVCSFQYVNEEPAMVLFPRHTKRGGAYVICLSAAYKYTDEKYLLSQAITASEVMGMGTGKSTVLRIAEVIVSGLQDMIEMKPEPEDEKPSLGEGALIVDGKTISEFEVRH